jgi:hypothetical protein
MTMLRVDFKTAKGMFFDRAKVKRKVDARTKKVLSKFGAFVRQTSRRSIRTRKKSSSPGEPPSSHTGTLKKFIFFGYDSHRRSVVIGPVVADGKSGKASAALEYGGTVTITSGAAKGKTATIEPRPFMGPAFVKEQTTLPGLWRDSIK